MSTWAQTCDGADNDDALEAVFRGVLDVFQQQVGEQEVAQMVCCYTQLVAIGCVAWFLGCGEVHCSVADQAVQPPTAVPEILQ